MVLLIRSENRLKRKLRYAHYLLTQHYPWKVGTLLRRIESTGFTLGVTSGLYIHFRVMSKSEYHNRYCGKTVSICRGRHSADRPHIRLITSR